ncbi:hypothetical protein GLOIN_2v1770668 [Rhizophagus irregularis DAOM 181602=DAOM 197198]|nr:hypothetical protein GLOIN_2v1770668 [Rhizophagus irregularis DAOM 181602=DAOM 197198]
MMDNNKHNFSPHPSPLIKFGQLNVNGLCSPVRQQHLLNFFLHSSFGALSINDTRLSPSNAKFIFKNEHSLHHFKSYWACSSSSSRPYDGVDILFLLRLLSSQFFTDHQDHSSTNGPDPTFFHDNGSSRLDYIWSSPSFPAPGLFLQVVTCPGLLDRPFTDHKVLTTVFDFIEQWNNFTTEVDDSLGVYLDRQYHPNFDFSSLSLDRMWHALKAAIISAAIETLPFQKFLDRFLYRLTTRRSNRPTQIAQMTAALPSHLENLASLLPDYSNLVSAFLSTKFAQHLTDSVEYYTALRDEHFLNSLGTFIDSALSVEKRSIVLDRVLVVLDSTPTLLTDPSDIKHAAVSHFQSIVSPPLTRYSSIISFPA